MNLKKQAISGMKWTSVTTISKSIVQLVQISILSRYLSKESFGLVAVALVVIQFTNIFVDMGMTSAILHKQNATKKEYSSIYWLNLFIAIILYFIIFFSSPFISEFYNQTELNILVPILGTNIILMATGRQHRTIMQKQLNFKSIAIIELISCFIGFIIAVFFVMKGYGVYSLVYSTLTVSFISNFLFLYRNLKLNPILFHFRIHETKAFLKIGGFTMGSTLLDFFAKEMDILIIGKLLGPESLGVYSLSKQIVLKLFAMINPIVTNVLSPLLSSIQNQKERLKQSYLNVIKYLAYINFPVYLLVIVLSKEILYVLYGESYVEAHFVLSFLAFSYCLSALNNPVGSLQIGTGRTDIGFKWTIFRICITPPIIFAGALINIESVSGFYAILSLLLIVPIWFIQLKPMINVSLKEYILQFYKPLVFFILVSLFTIYIDYGIIGDYLILNIFLKIIITLALFALYIVVVDKKVIIKILNFKS